MFHVNVPSDIIMQVFDNWTWAVIGFNGSGSIPSLIKSEFWLNGHSWNATSAESVNDLKDSDVLTADCSIEVWEASSNP